MKFEIKILKVQPVEYYRLLVKKILSNLVDSAEQDHYFDHFGVLNLNSTGHLKPNIKHLNLL